MQLCPVSCTTAEHYTWGNNSDGWYLVKNDKLGGIEERMPPATSEVLHITDNRSSSSSSCPARLVMGVDGHETRLSAGEGLLILPGSQHQIGNVSKKPGQFLVISQPRSHGDRVLLGMTHD